MRLFGPHLCTLLAALLLHLNGAAQLDSAKERPDSSRLSLRLNALAFFDNREYSGPIKKGYTLPGFFVEPLLAYGHGRFSMEAGLHVAYLAGADSLRRIVPMLSLQYRPAAWFAVRLGTLQHTTHGLPEPLYRPENIYATRPDLGLDLAVRRPHLRTNLWLNWTRYIDHGSPFQEHFMVGLSTRYRPLAASSVHLPELGVFAVAAHQGGQIDNSDLPVTTLLNAAISLAYSYRIVSSQRLGAEFVGVAAKDASPNPHLPYAQGYGLLAQATWRTRPTSLAIGYWHAQNLVLTEYGEPLYGSVSTVDSASNQPQRQLLRAAFAFHPRLKERGVHLRLSAGLLVDLKRSAAIDYFYALTIGFNGQLWQRKR